MKYKKGITFGAFDMCHAGHMMMFKECKNICDYLIVGLHVDPSLTDEAYRGKKKHKPIMSAEERKIILEGIRYVDEVIVYESEEDLYNILKENKYNIDVRIIGDDWRGKKFTGYDLPVDVHFNSRNHGFSTTELIERIRNREK